MLLPRLSSMRSTLISVLLAFSIPATFGRVVYGLLPAPDQQGSNSVTWSTAGLSEARGTCSLAAAAPFPDLACQPFPDFRQSWTEFQSAATYGVPAVESGRVRWYGPNFHGKLTASGEIHNMHRLTAAHPTLPFGTTLLVTDLISERSVIVRINDRGTYIGRRFLELSYAAAMQLGMVHDGLAQVRLERLEEPKSSSAVSRQAPLPALVRVT